MLTVATGQRVAEWSGSGHHPGLIQERLGGAVPIMNWEGGCEGPLRVR